MALQNYLFDWVTGENGLSSFSCEDIPTLMFKCHMTVFGILFVIAITGKKTGLRRLYIIFLEKLFQFTASKMEEQKRVRDLNNAIEQILEEEELTDDDDDARVVISPDTPVAPRFFQSSQSFSLADPMPYISAGILAISQDPFVSKFGPEDLDSWNMLTRTKNTRKEAKSITLLWVIGFFFRYTYLLPIRLIIFVASFSTLITCTFLVGLLPDGPFKRKVNAFVITWCFDFVANSLSVFARFHDVHNRPEHGIAVANHTSPIDSMILATDHCYDMVGQKGEGVLGLFMTALSRSSTHIWFERANGRDRSTVSKLMQAHASNRELPPILIYPEGICVNNTAVMIFRKGVFELDSVINPIAMRFDARYGDPFWWQDGFFLHILCMMSSWAIVCDIWYLPPMRKCENESSAHFAGRVRSLVAQKAGLNELDWDGYTRYLTDSLKKQKEEQWRKKQQLELAKNFPKNCRNQSESGMNKNHSNAQTQTGVA